MGIITQVTISDDTFPFNYYDVNQFDYCLTAATVKDNLDAITQKVDQLDYLSIVLSKLQEVGSVVWCSKHEIGTNIRFRFNNSY